MRDDIIFNTALIVQLKCLQAIHEGEKIPIHFTQAQLPHYPAASSSLYLFSSATASKLSNPEYPAS